MLEDITKEGNQLGRLDELLLKSIYHHLPVFVKGQVTKNSQLVERGDLVGNVRSEFDKADLGHVHIKEFNWAVRELLASGLIGKRDDSYYRERRDFASGDLSEISYYDGILRELDTSWVEDPVRAYHLRQRFVFVLDTHHAGRRRTGSWARPDLTVVGGKLLPNLPGKFLDVHTFEVKIGLNLQGLYEALAHQRRSHYSHLMCIWPEVWGNPSPQEVSNVSTECARQGIGLYLLRQHDDATQWDELVVAERHAPDPQLLNDYLEEQRGRGEFIKELREWIQRPDGEVRPTISRDVERLFLTSEETIIAKTIVERLQKESNLRDHDFEEFHEKKDQYKKAKEALKRRQLIRTNYSNLETASTSI